MGKVLRSYTKEIRVISVLSALVILPDWVRRLLPCQEQSRDQADFPLQEGSVTISSQSRLLEYLFRILIIPFFE
jgi:hypothetical protein